MTYFLPLNFLPDESLKYDLGEVIVGIIIALYPVGGVISSMI